MSNGTTKYDISLILVATFILDFCYIICCISRKQSRVFQLLFYILAIYLRIIFSMYHQFTKLYIHIIIIFFLKHLCVCIISVCAFTIYIILLYKIRSWKVVLRKDNAIVLLYEKCPKRNPRRDTSTKEEKRYFFV